MARHREQRGHEQNERGDIAGPLLFAVVVLAGCAYIVLAKAERLEAWAVTLVPVVFMLVYAVLIGAVGAVRLRSDQAGDNLYYMGFLFTLTSLGVSLYQFRADGAAEQIVQNFGIAVGSTIAGVALRVLFTQMRRDPVDVEQAARLELAEAARRMRRELDGTVLELASFRRASQQAMAEGFDEVRAGMAEVSTRIVQRFEEMAAHSVAPFASASRSSSEALDAMTTSIGESLEMAARRLADENMRLSDGVQHLTSVLSDASVRLTGLSTPETLVDARFDALVARLTQTVEGLAARAAAPAGEPGREAAEAESRKLEQADLKPADPEAQARRNELHDLATALASSIRDLGDRLDRQTARIEAVAARLAEHDAERRAPEGSLEALTAVIARERLEAGETGIRS